MIQFKVCFGLFWPNLVGEDKYAFVHRLKEFLYSFFHALPINSIHKPLISIKIEFSSKVLILSLFIVEMFDF